MSSRRVSRLLIILAFLVLVAGLSAGVWRQSYVQALGPLAARGEADLALASDRLATQLQRYREFAVLMADHPALAGLDAASANRRRAASRVLLEAADKTGTLTAFYADTGGRVLAAAHDVTPRDLTSAAYFRRALNGALGAAHGSTAGFPQRTYSFAAPAFGPDGRVRGVLVAVVDIDDLEEDWRGSQPTVLFTDRDGEVFVTNRSELLFADLQDLTALTLPSGETLPARMRHVQDHAILEQRWSPYVPGTALLLRADLPVIDLTGHALINVWPAQRLAYLQAAAVASVCLFFGALLWLATERRLTLAAANAELENRVAARTEALESANTALRREVAERQEAEAALKRAQDELVQAGKLSALGKMSAGISHELNQPLMAIRSFAENSAEFLQRGQTEKAAQNLTRISDMARRMGRIIKNLRAFARQESEPITRVDLAAVLSSAAELAERRIAEAGVALDWTPPDHPVWVRGGEVRLGQVFVNLVTNAVDAMEAVEDRHLSIRIEEDGSGLLVHVRDTGPGITEPERIFDPFYSTKSVGSAEGMGLGLSISYGLVQSFGGTIRGANHPEGGSIFTVRLERWLSEEAA